MTSGASCSPNEVSIDNHRSQTSAVVSIALQKLVASDRDEFDRFGEAIAISGDTAIVGAPGAGGPGAVYVYVRGGSGWTQQQKLTASPSGAVFGQAVALEGDTALIADLDTVTVPGTTLGIVYVFVRSAGSFTQRQKLQASDGQTGNAFGHSIALSGNTALIGDPNGDLGVCPPEESCVRWRGAAYVFMHNGTSWAQTQKLTATDGEAYDLLGWSVALAGNVALVGRPEYEVGANTNQGAAHLFRRVGTTWSESQVLTALDGAPQDLFGASVAVSAENALVGTNSNTHQGAAYVFGGAGTSWTQQQKLVASDASTTDGFGQGVALQGARAVIGAPFANSPTVAFPGAAYGFVRTAAGWVERQKFMPGDPQSNYRFGRAVALNAATAMAGAPFDGGPGFTSAGSAHVFTADNTGASCTQPSNCTSGFCADGVCCDAACTGQCQACAETGNLGHCITVTGAPRAARPICSGTGACQGTCNGGNANACAYPGTATTCAGPSCNGDNLSPSAQCNGAGACSSPAPQSCAPFTCNAASNACKIACSTNSDCATGYACSAGGCVVLDAGTEGGADSGGTDASDAASADADATSGTGGTSSADAGMDGSSGDASVGTGGTQGASTDAASEGSAGMAGAMGSGGSGAGAAGAGNTDSGNAGAAGSGSGAAGTGGSSAGGSGGDAGSSAGTGARAGTAGRGGGAGRSGSGGSAGHGDDEGCSIGQRGSRSSSWFLFASALLGFVVSRRRIHARGQS